MGKRELVALVSLSSWCFLMFVWLFLAVTWVCLRFVIVVFPDHTHIQKCGSNTTAGEFVSVKMFTHTSVYGFRFLLELSVLSSTFAFNNLS